jgi:hypothetical protein
MATESWSLFSSTVTLSTELNSLGNGNFSNVGAGGVSGQTTGSGNPRFAFAELLITFGSSPLANSVVELYAVFAPDGTHYSDGSSSVTPSNQLFVATFVVQASTSAQRLHTARFDLPPFLTKFLVRNRTTVSFPASGTTINLFAFNRQIN